MRADSVRLPRSIHVATAAIVASVCVGTNLTGQSTSADWPTYNRSFTSERYAPLDQIDRTNVSRLRQVCVYDLKVDTNFQTGPIVIGGTLYATTDKEILALDASTCQQKWRVSEPGPSVGLSVNRGAAYVDGRLFRGTSDGDLAAYDAQTGEKLWTTRLASRTRRRRSRRRPSVSAPAPLEGPSGTAQPTVPTRISSTAERWTGV